LSGDSRIPRLSETSHLPQEHPRRDLPPVAFPFFRLQPGKEEFTRVHEAGEDLVPITGDIADFPASIGQDHEKAVEPRAALVAQGRGLGDALIDAVPEFGVRRELVGRNSEPLR